ncbi:MAG TPA: DUF1634 domain-containing protein [Candidatus Angelobacter sp.]
MMHPSNSSHPYLESLLANVLQYGSWAASAIIGAGLALSLISAHALPFSGMKIVTAGVALFILLPVFRVFIMFLVFLRDRDYKFSAIAALVLAILALGVIVGLRAAKMVAGSQFKF